MTTVTVTCPACGTPVTLTTPDPEGAPAGTTETTDDKPEGEPEPTE